MTATAETMQEDSPSPTKISTKGIMAQNVQRHKRLHENGAHNIKDLLQRQIDRVLTSTPYATLGPSCNGDWTWWGRFPEHNLNYNSS